jgi:hypothetical protein
MSYQKMMDRMEWQRLVDGELSHEERRRLLLKLGDTLEPWRSLALALLEEQAFRQHFSKPETVEASPAAVELAPAAGSLEPMPEGRQPLTRFYLIPPPSAAAGWRLLGYALAACLLLAVGFSSGYRWNGWESGRAGSTELLAEVDREAGGGEAAAVAAAEPTARRASSQPAMGPPRPIGELRLASGDGGIDPTSTIGWPVLEVGPDDVQQIMEQQRRQVQAWNQQLRERGLQVDWQPEMLESRLPDGRAMIVPINQWNVRSIGQ